MTIQSRETPRSTNQEPRPRLWTTVLQKLFFIEEWTLGLGSLPSGGLQELIVTGSIGTIRCRPSSGNASFVADPFVWLRNGVPYVLFESYDFWSCRGRISSLPLSGLLEMPVMVNEICSRGHLSYPFTIFSNGAWYCVPESSESLNVRLYIWDEATDDWRFVSRILEGVALLDPSLCFLNGMWYMFGTLKGDDPHGKLNLWYSESLDRGWRPHPSNPIRTARDQVRSAGPLFVADGQLYRPSQDCRRGYGSGLILNRVDTLDVNQFKEVPVVEWRAMKNSPFPDGLHTITVLEDTLVVDVKRYRFSLFAVAWKLWWKLVLSVRNAQNLIRSNFREG
jgi:hypothetical protein